MYTGENQWTDERIALLTELWGKGWSAGQIATKMGGITRNAVLGKAHRIGLPKRKSPIPAVPSSDRTKRRKRQAKREAAEQLLSSPVLIFDNPVYEVVAEPLAMEPEGRYGCQWIEGSPDHTDDCKCNARRALGKPYCPDHAARAYLPRRKKAEAA